MHNKLSFSPARIFKQAKKKGKWDDSKSKDPPGRYVVGQIVPSSGFPSPNTTLLHQKMVVHSRTIYSRGNHSGVQIWLHSIHTQLQVQAKIKLQLENTTIHSRAGLPPPLRGSAEANRDCSAASAEGGRDSPGSCYVVRNPSQILLQDRTPPISSRTLLKAYISILRSSPCFASLALV